MATEGVRLREGGNLVAGADLSAKQYYAVKLSATARQVVLVAASTDTVLGVLENKPTSGQAADINFLGFGKASAGAAISAGAAVMANSSGQMIPWVSGSGNCIAGYAVEAAAGANVIFLMEVKPAPVIT